VIPNSCSDMPGQVGMARRLRGTSGQLRRGTGLWAGRKIRICVLRRRCDRSDVGWTMSVGRPRNLGLTLTRSQTLLDAQGRRRGRELGAGTTHDRKLSLPRDLSLGHKAHSAPPLARPPARLPSAYLIKKPTNPKILLSADRLPSTSSFVLYIYLTDPSIVPPLAPSH
jgi:hypothetical protein